MRNTDLQSALIAARAKNLSAGTLGMLTILGSGAATLTSLAKDLGVTGSAATGLADRLDKLGYAIRRHDLIDRRVIFLEITPQGESALKEILAVQPEPAVA